MTAVFTALIVIHVTPSASLRLASANCFLDEMGTSWELTIAQLDISWESAARMPQRLHPFFSFSSSAVSLFWAMKDLPRERCIWRLEKTGSTKK